MLSSSPVFLATSATIFAATVSISASVNVFSRGCSVTLSPTDFLPAGTPVPSYTSKMSSPAISARSAPCAARMMSAARTPGVDDEREVALERHQLGRSSFPFALVGFTFGAGIASSTSSKPTSGPFDVERLEQARVEFTEPSDDVLRAELQRADRPG